MFYGVHSNTADQLIIIIISIYSVTQYNSFAQLNTAERLFHAVADAVNFRCMWVFACEEMTWKLSWNIRHSDAFY
jgi:hypothetical protein